MLDPTPEQKDILAAAKDTKTSLMIRARAGTGKTTTLEMLSHALSGECALALAFNVSIKKELEKRFSKNFTIKTMNGLGHGAFGKAIGRRCEVDDRKLGKLITQITKEEGFAASSEQWLAIKTLVSEAQTAGLIPSTYPQTGLVEDDEPTWRTLCDEAFIDADERIMYFARKTLIANIKQAFAGILSFDDQIYMSALFGGIFPRFPVVMVDESQDTNKLNHIQIRRCAADRIIVVGDLNQSIYAFRGADAHAIESLRALRKDWIDLPLATTFRCPKIIVERQHHLVPDFRAYESNPNGTFTTLPTGEAITAAQATNTDEPAKWRWSDVTAHCTNGDRIAVLCRNNAPLISFAFKLIRQSIPAQMLGRDIGKGLVALSRKLLPNDELDARSCVTVIEDWRATEISKAQINNEERKIDGINDRAESLIAVLTSGHSKNAGDLRQAIEDLFSRTNDKVTLSTGHKSKGLEWEVVVHLDPANIPARYALKQGGVALAQEYNLQYVIETRTKRVLLEANLKEFDSGD